MGMSAMSAFRSTWIRGLEVCQTCEVSSSGDNLYPSFRSCLESSLKPSHQSWPLECARHVWKASPLNNSSSPIDTVTFPAIQSHECKRLWSSSSSKRKSAKAQALRAPLPAPPPGRNNAGGVCEDIPRGRNKLSGGGHRRPHAQGHVSADELEMESRPPTEQQQSSDADLDSERTPKIRRFPIEGRLGIAVGGGGKDGDSRGNSSNGSTSAGEVAVRASERASKISAKTRLLETFRYRRRFRGGAMGDGWFIVRAMSNELLPATVELLANSFAELFGVAYMPLLSVQVLTYLRTQQKCIPYGITLVGLWYPDLPTEDEQGKEPRNGRGEVEQEGGVRPFSSVERVGEVVGTVELSFDVRSRPQFPTLNPPKSAAYLCNMAVMDSMRKRGLGKELLIAAEDLAVEVGVRDMYLHCRIVDTIPKRLYERSGYDIIATDNIFALFFLQPRRHLMMKKLLRETAPHDATL